jgi:hypothetical protein
MEMEIRAWSRLELDFSKGFAQPANPGGFQRNGVRLYPKGCQTQVTWLEEDLPPSNGRIQNPGYVCGTKYESPIIVISYSCGERETQMPTLRALARVSQNL